tara:strand:+ start:1232 stop:2812 length:1581 start_codon:yes stop_codon:yes gene_type:complete
MTDIDERIKQLQNKIASQTTVTEQEDNKIPISEVVEGATNVAKNVSPVKSRDDIKNFGRMFLGQGLALGFGDELESAGRALFSDKDYNEILNEVRGELNQFKEDRPVASTVAELAGSLGTGAFGIGRTVAKTALKSGALGGIYGAGATDTGEDEFSKDALGRIENAVNSALFSAGIGATAQKLLKTTPQAKKLLDKGIKLTPGQTMGGVIGQGLRTIEEAATSIPGLGTQSAFNNVKRTYNIAVANEIGKDIGVKIAKNTKVKDVAKELNKKIQKEFEDVVPKLKADDTDELIDLLVSQVKRSGSNKNIINREIKDLTDNYLILGQNAKGELAGNGIQKLDIFLRDKFKKYSRSDNTDLLVLSDIFKKGSDDLINSINKNSGAFGERYSKVKNAFKNKKIFNSATLSSSTKPGFTPSQLIQASKKADPTKGKTGTIMGKGQLQSIGNTGQDVIGMNLPDSGTTTRGIVGAGLLGGLALDPVTTGLGSLGLLAYKNPTIRNSLIGGKGIIKSSPFLGSALGERFGIK